MEIDLLSTPVNYSWHVFLRANLAGGFFAMFGPQLSFDCNCLHFIKILDGEGKEKLLIIPSFQLRMNKEASDTLIFVGIADGDGKKVGHRDGFDLFGFLS